MMNPFLLLRRGVFSAVLAGAGAGAAEPPDLDAAIRAHRTGTIVVQTAPGADVRVDQQRHAFWFGAALSSQAFGGRMDPADRTRYLETFRRDFNAAVTENALKWHVMEPVRGRVDYAVVDRILAWSDANGIPVRGHNVFWGIPNRVQPWQKELGDAELRGVLEARAVDIARRYRGRFAEYDLNNEMVHANYYEQRFGPDITRDMAAWMRREDPAAVLYLNDYDITTGRRLDDYVKQIRTLLAQGVPIGGIGVQGHLHGDTFDAAILQRALERLAEFKLPIRITEFNLPGQRSKYYQKPAAVLTAEEEQAKARGLTEFYRICFAQPAVTGIMMWGFWEGANWIPVSSLYRRDWTPTPAATAYRDLVYKTWWTTWQGRADARGRCEVRAFFGEHQVTVGDRKVAVKLPPESPVVTVSVHQP